MEKPLHLQADLAEAEAALARTEADLAQLPYQIRSAEARLEQSRLDLTAKQNVPQAVPETLLIRARTVATGS